MGNLSEEGNATSSATFNITTVTIIFCSFNILLFITAFLGNALILIALRNVSSLYPPTKLLFQCLAMTDFGVGLTLQPFYAIQVLYSAINVNWDIFLFFRYKLGFVNLSLWSFPVHKDYSKCGLTSRPFIEAKVKARRNTKASSCSYFLLLFNFCFVQIHVLVLE